MNRTEHLLIKASEECDEVGQRAAKALRFGLKEVYRDETNAESFVREVKDLMVVLVMLRREGLIPDFMPTFEEQEAVEAKIEKYLEYSRSLGRLTDFVEVPGQNSDPDDVVNLTPSKREVVKGVVS